VLDDDKKDEILAGLAGTAEQIKRTAKLLYKTVPVPLLRGEVERLLAKGLKHSDWEVRLECVRAMETWYSGEYLPVLWEKVRDDELLVREAACYALVHIGEPRYVQPIVNMLNYGPQTRGQNPSLKDFDPDRERALAVRCLIALGPALESTVRSVRGMGTPQAKSAAEEILQAYATAPGRPARFPR
jgi:hypothetical protein